MKNGMNFLVYSVIYFCLQCFESLKIAQVVILRTFKTSLVPENDENTLTFIRFPMLNVFKN